MTVIEQRDATVKVQDSTLMVHTGGGIVTRKFLQTLPRAEKRGSKHVPINFDTFCDNLERALLILNHPIKPDTMQIALSKDAGKMFGMVELEQDDLIPDEVGNVLGFRTSTNCTMSSMVVIGGRVFVCDNLCFSGREWIIRKKSTKNLNLTMALFQGLEAYFLEGTGIKGLIENARNVKISSSEAKALFWDCYTKKLIPQKFFPAANAFYFDGQHEEIQAPECDRYRGRIWGVYNSLTRAIKTAPLAKRYEHTKNLGQLLNLN